MKAWAAFIVDQRSANKRGIVEISIRKTHSEVEEVVNNLFQWEPSPVDIREINITWDGENETKKES